jgi:Zn-dependent peptidase ImmA (M78 family)
MSAEAWTPSKAASKLTHILNAFATASGEARFPIDVPNLAAGAADLFKWPDPITEVQSAPIPGFEGALVAADDRSEWMLLYNDSIASLGRIRFTQAHELGHYVLHRADQDRFQCTEDDMVQWVNGRNIEAEADSFAAQVLMPLDDFRAYVGTQGVDLDLLSASADRYGVSLTAAAHRWIEHTEESAVLVISRDGYVDYARSSKRAASRGAFVRTKSRPPVALRVGSLAESPDVAHDRRGVTVDSRAWFPASDEEFPIREMKITSDRYSSVMTLLVLPRFAKAWAPWDTDAPR